MFFFFDDSHNEPYDANSIRIEQKNFSVFQVMHWIDTDKLIMQPEFQRNLVWNVRAKSLLIESLILRIPIPVFYFSEDYNGVKTIIDGLQRTNAIYEFITGKYKLKGLQYLEDCDNLSFDELSSNYRRRIEDTQLSINILDASCPMLVKYDVFHRINTQGMVLNKQEIRNILLKPEVRAMLIDLSKSNSFKLITHDKISDKRMGAQELCLRIITAKSLLKEDGCKYVKFSDFSQEMDKETRRLNDLGLTELLHIKNETLKCFEMCYRLFGKDAFMLNGLSKRKSFNKLLFVSFAVLLQTPKYHDLSLGAPCSEMNAKLDYLVESEPEYKSALKSATTSYRHMTTQLQYTNCFLEKLL